MVMAVPSNSSGQRCRSIAVAPRGAGRGAGKPKLSALAQTTIVGNPTEARDVAAQWLHTSSRGTADIVSPRRGFCQRAVYGPSVPPTALNSREPMAESTVCSSFRHTGS